MIKFIQDQYDHYTVYDCKKEIGYMACSNYHSAENQNFRIWHFRIDYGKGETYDGCTVGTISKAKKEFISFFIDTIPKHLEWIKALSE